MKIEITEHKSVNQLRAPSTQVRVFVDSDYHYGYFVDEHFLFGLLTPEQQANYLKGSSAKLEVDAKVAQQIIDEGSTPYGKQKLV